MLWRILGIDEKLEHLSGSARRVLSILGSMERNRSELFLLEAREELRQGMVAGVLTGAMLLFAVLLVLAATGLVLYLVHPDYRSIALLAMAMAYGVASLAGGLIIFLQARGAYRRLRSLAEEGRRLKAMAGGRDEAQRHGDEGSSPNAPGPGEGRPPRGNPMRGTTGRVVEDVKGEKCFWFPDDQP